MTVKATTAQKSKATKKVAKSIELDENALAILNAFRKAKEAEAKAKEAKAIAEAQLREILGEITEATVSGATVLKVVAGRNTHFDREMLEQVYPEAFNATIRSTSYTYLKTL